MAACNVYLDPYNRDEFQKEHINFKILQQIEGPRTQDMYTPTAWKMYRVWRWEMHQEFMQTNGEIAKDPMCMSEMRIATTPGISNGRTI